MRSGYDGWKQSSFLREANYDVLFDNILYIVHLIHFDCGFHLSHRLAAETLHVIDMSSDMSDAEYLHMYMIWI